MNSQIELDNIIDAINRADRIGIFTHISPDGDAIGSSLALYMGLKQLKKDVEVIVDECSLCFNFLPCIDDVKSKGDGKYDLVIALDCASKPRLFDTNNCFDKCEVSVVIDHHVSNTYYGRYNYVEGDSPAVCMTLVKILKRLCVSINLDIGTCLMAGIITDSGGFRYSSVDDETFEFAANMLDVGVNISDIYYRTFDVKTRAQFDLSRIALDRMKFYSKDRIALTYVTLADMKKTKALVGDHEGIVNVGRNIEGVLVSIFLREDEDGCFRVSLRSNNDINVSDVAEVFGGGGHENAAGCIMECELETAIKLLVKEVNKVL